MNNNNNRRGGGGIMQLVAYGAPDAYLTGNTSDALPSNMRDSMASRWFVAREDGAATRGDIVGSATRDDLVSTSGGVWTDELQTGCILAHAPASMAPLKGSIRPFSVREERLANPPKTTFTDYESL
jgi:hypothetical protein